MTKKKLEEPLVVDLAEVEPEVGPEEAVEELRAQVAALEAERDALAAQVARLEAERDALAAQVARLEARLNPPPEIARPRSCINCGQKSQPVAWDGERFSCPVCKHTWGPEDELAPFRLGR